MSYKSQHNTIIMKIIIITDGDNNNKVTKANSNKRTEEEYV